MIMRLKDLNLLSRIHHPYHAQIEENPEGFSCHLFPGYAGLPITPLPQTPAIHYGAYKEDEKGVWRLVKDDQEKGKLEQWCSDYQKEHGCCWFAIQSDRLGNLSPILQPPEQTLVVRGRGWRGYRSPITP